MTFESPTTYTRASEYQGLGEKSKQMTELPDNAPSELSKLSASHEGEHHNDFGGDIRITKSTYIFALCAALNSVNLGYDIGTSTSAGPFRCLVDHRSLHRCLSLHIRLWDGLANRLLNQSNTFIDRKTGTRRLGADNDTARGFCWKSQFMGK